MPPNFFYIFSYFKDSLFAFLSRNLRNKNPTKNAFHKHTLYRSWNYIFYCKYK